MKDDAINRVNVKRGKDLPQSKLTEEDVIEARKLHAEYMQTIKDLNSTFSIPALAKRYGVHERTMEKAISGITWSHIA